MSSLRPSNLPADMGARAAVVNRTHRVVRAEALIMREQKARKRSLWVPVALCSTLLLLSCYAAWTVVDGYEFATNGVLDGSYQVLVFLAWSLPLMVLVLSLIWYGRIRARINGDL